MADTGLNHPMAIASIRDWKRTKAERYCGLPFLTLVPGQTLTITIKSRATARKPVTFSTLDV